MCAFIPFLDIRLRAHKHIMFLGSRVYNELFSVKQRKTTGQNYRPFILQKGLFRDSAVYFRRSKEVIRCCNDTAMAWLTDGHAAS